MKTESKFYKFERFVLLVLTVLYFVIACYYYIGREITSGDETLFLADLSYIDHFGWVEAIKKNISIPFMLLAYPFTIFFGDQIALRLTNLLLIFSFFIYLKSTRLGNIFQYSYVLFYFSAAAFFFFGSNDTLFSLSLAIFLIESSRSAMKTTYHPILAISALIVCIFTRELFIIYLPVIITGLYIMRQSFRKFSTGLYIPISLLSLFLLLNVPSIQENKSLSYDLKAPPKKIDATWTQRQYLAQIWVNQGKIEFHSHPTWKQTEEYLQLNGRESLPKGIINGLLFDLKITLTEFIKDLTYVIIYHTRTVGLMFLTGLLIALKRILMSKQLSTYYFLPISTIVMILIFSLIIISYVELRWLGPVFIGSIIFYSEMERRDKVPFIFNKLNLYFLILLTCYGLYGLFIKI